MKKVLQSLSSLRVKILLPLTLVCLVGTYGLYTEISKMYREQKEQAYVANARALLLSAESAREYAATQFNKDLFRKDIKKKDDLLYTVPVFAAIQVAKNKAKELGMEIKVPKFSPRNPDNLPDEFEAGVLKKLESGTVAEYYEIDAKTDKLRFFRPVKLTAECLNCHGDPANSMALWGNNEGLDATGTKMENWKEGEVHGAFEVLMPMAPVRAAAEAGATQIAKYLMIMLAFILAIGLLIAFMVMRPVKRLMKANAEVSSGDLNTRVVVSSKDELGSLSESFNSMVESIKEAQESSEQNRKYLSESVATILQSMDRFSQGDMTVQIESQSNDDIGRLKSGFNQMINAIRESTEKDEQQRRYLAESVRTVLDAMKRFAAGDLTTSLEVRSDDEIGQLMAGFNDAVQNLRSIVENVLDAVEATASASAQISSSTEQMAAGSHEQTLQSADVASAVEEMTKTIIENSANARSTADMAQQAQTTADSGVRVLQETVHGMRRIADVVHSSATTVEALGKSSIQIGEIISVINDIADQTNLLALNAAIEAARAGEQGRGFAVVADEVRKLAERTTKATKEISTMIQTIQRDTSSAVASIDEGTREVNAGIAMTDQAGSAFNEISEAVKKVSGMINQIAVASEEQSNASETISRSVQGISEVTSQTATGTEQIAHAADDLNRLTENLHQLVSHFTLHEGGNKAATSRVHYAADKSVGRSGYSNTRSSSHAPSH